MSIKYLKTKRKKYRNLILNNKMVSFLKSNNIMTFVYTLKDIKLLPWIQKYNIDGIVTDIYYD